MHRPHVRPKYTVHELNTGSRPFCTPMIYNSVSLKVVRKNEQSSARREKYRQVDPHQQARPQTLSQDSVPQRKQSSLARDGANTVPKIR